MKGVSTRCGHPLCGRTSYLLEFDDVDAGAHPHTVTTHLLTESIRQCGEEVVLPDGGDTPITPQADGLLIRVLELHHLHEDVRDQPGFGLDPQDDMERASESLAELVAVLGVRMVVVEDVVLLDGDLMFVLRRVVGHKEFLQNDNESPFELPDLGDLHVPYFVDGSKDRKIRLGRIGRHQSLEEGLPVGHVSVSCVWHNEDIPRYFAYNNSTYPSYCQ